MIFLCSSQSSRGFVCLSVPVCCGARRPHVTFFYEKGLQICCFFHYLSRLCAIDHPRVFAVAI